MPSFNKRKILDESNESNDHAINIFVHVRLTLRRREKDLQWIFVEPLSTLN